MMAAAWNCFTCGAAMAVTVTWTVTPTSSKFFTTEAVSVCAKVGSPAPLMMLVRLALKAGISIPRLAAMSFTLVTGTVIA